MKRLASIAATLAIGLMTVSAYAADMKLKAKAPEPPPSPWDFAWGSALMSDYNFRGITQSNHKPSVSAYFEPRYNLSDTWQLYSGVSGESIAFPNRAAAEIDWYGGIRPTLGKLALDFGAWYYWYPGGQCFNNPAPFSPPLAPQPADCVANGSLPVNFNVIKADLSFWEVYAKATYTVNDQWSYGGNVWYSPSVLNSGADGTFLAGNLTYNVPGTFLTMFPGGVTASISGDVGYWWLGTSDSFYGVINPAFPNYVNGIPYKSYATWDAGLTLNWKKFSLDLRYYDSNLNKGDCNAFTSSQSASLALPVGTAVTPINPAGASSNWCSSAFVVKFSSAFTLADLAPAK